MKKSPVVIFLSLITLSAVMSLPSITNAQSSESSEQKNSGMLIVANKAGRTLGIVNADDGTQIVEIPETGITGHELAASPDGQTAFVPIYGNSGVGKPGTDGKKIDVINLRTRKVTSSIDFDHGVRPHCAVFGPKNGLLYVTTELDRTVTIIDPKTLKIIGTIPTDQPESHMLAISPDGTRGYTANVGPGTVSVLDMDARKVLKVIHISKETQRISISPDGSMVFTSDQTKPQLAVIDTASNTVKAWVPLPGTGYGTASTSDGRWLLVAVPPVNKVAVVDLKTLKVAHVLDVPSSPQEVMVRPDDKVAYVSCDRSNQVAAIDIGDWKVQKLIDTGKGVDGLSWAAE